MKDSKLNEVTFAASVEYEKNVPTMLEELNARMIKLNEELKLIGRNPVSVMLDEHKNHAKFMTTVLKLNDFDMLKKTLVWVVRRLESKGFKAEYIQYQLNHWIEMINEHLEPDDAREIIQVYEMIKDEVKIIVEEEKTEVYQEYPYDSHWLKLKNTFTRLLLDGKYGEVIKFVKDIVHDKKSIEEFYIKVMAFSMYEVGKMWQEGRISVVQEHLATSIVMRVMATVYLDFVLVDYHKGKCIVSAACNESHEVGARVVADILELDGWDVKYLGANISNEKLIKCIKEENPVFIALSVTIAYNLDHVKKLIEDIRLDESIKDTKILLGGLALNYLSGDVELGADMITNDTNEMIKITRMWWEREKAHE